MRVRAAVRHLRPLALAGLVLYAVFLLCTPFEHHDLSCELKTPQHCTACASSVVGPDLGVRPRPGTLRLADAGAADTVDIAPHSVLLAVRTTGRSPPRVL